MLTCRIPAKTDSLRRGISNRRDHTATASPIAAGGGVALAGRCLPAYTCAGGPPPLAPFIGDELALTQALTGALTTLPILMLAIGAMPGSLAISRIGPRNTLALAMVIMVIGSAGRGLVPDTFTLMIASAVMGLGVAMMQPALPALLPRCSNPPITLLWLGHLHERHAHG